MKGEGKSSKPIEISVWQLIAIGVALVACVFSLFPLLSQYRVYTCAKIEIQEEKSIEIPFIEENHDEKEEETHHRYVRDTKALQCGIVPPICLATTTQRSTASTVTFTRPAITTPDVTEPTTTADPWANSTRPYNSWRLPTLAKPIRYALNFNCPDCFDLISIPPVISFDGQATIDFDLTNTTTFLVLHGKNLKINSAQITNVGPLTAKIVYIPEFEMVYLDFSPTILPIGQHVLALNYEGRVNQADEIGFYREIFWKSSYQLSYVLGANFHPIHARQAFPCFDEPQLTAEFVLTLQHATNETLALSNVDVDTTSATSTTFKPVPNLSTHELTWAILPRDEFQTVSKTFSGINVSIWIREELIGENEENLNFAFDVVDKTIQFAAAYLTPGPEDLPTKLDLIGVPDFVIDEKALTNYGLITFREEFLSRDPSLYSAERTQTTAKVIAEHILQLWLTKVDWWNNAWFGKSLSNFLSYKAVETSYPDFGLMEQFSIREITPFMMDDIKPSAWIVANQKLSDNQDVIESFSPSIYSKGASILRLVEHIIGEDTFKSALQTAIISSNKITKLADFYAALGSGLILDSLTTAESMIRSWVEEVNYPVVTVEFNPPNGTETNLRLNFRQNRFTGNYFATDEGIDPDYRWKIFLECQLGGPTTIDYDETTGADDLETLKFVLETETKEIVLPNGNLSWIKCNKDFYSFLLVDYEFIGDDPTTLWERFESLTYENILSANDKANLINDGLVLPHGDSTATFDRTISFFRRFFNPIENFLPWSVLVWHWNYLAPLEERSKYFSNFKQFATRQIFAPFGFDIENIVKNATDHRERLTRGTIFDLLCRVQNTNALQKATELFDQIPKEYFLESKLDANVGSDFLSTVIFYHIQNVNFIDEWDELWLPLESNSKLTSLQRQSIVRALSASKELWRLKFLLENWINNRGPLIETQEYFDIFTTISLNPAGRDVAWNFYRKNYGKLLEKFGSSNRLFNQLIVSISQALEDQFYFDEMNEFIFQNRSPSQTQRQALDQILINFQWIRDGSAEELDSAITAIDRKTSNKKHK